MDFLKKLFFLIIFLFPLGEIVRIDFGNGFAIKPLDVGVGALVLSWLIFKLFKKRKFKRTNILIPTILFVISGFFSLIINNLTLSSSQWLTSFSYLIRWIAYIGVFFVVSDFDKEFKNKMQKLLIVVGSLVVVLGYAQYFLYPSLKNLFYLGWDEHMYRMFSVFLDPNFAGAFFVLFFLFLVNMFLERKTVLTGLFSILTLGAVFLTFSRSALIMLIVGASMLFILMNKKILIIVLFAVISMVLVVSSRYFSIENINLFRVVSSEARLETARNAILIIKNNPIFGVGFNSYRYAQFHYGLRSPINIESHADASPDNSFLFILATTGIVGFILYLFLWIKIIKTASMLAIASIAGIFVDSMFINSLFYPSIMLWLWMIVTIKTNN